MFRLGVSLSFVALLLWSCGPDSRTCSGPSFRVLIKLTAKPLPPDTVVRVTYAGSAVENFRLSEPSAPHKAAFCRLRDENGAPLEASAATDAGAAGAAGATADPGEPAQVVASIFCELWTAGFAELKVSGSGFDTVIHDLAPKQGQCTVDEPPLVLDSPDAGAHP
ncbi:MAG TPA: hypothetical protein VJV79_34015 [Polyangiaceae bacterium]|nr:hypothetical protein [Polyangiaceae bacterium]